MEATFRYRGLPQCLYLSIDAAARAIVIQSVDMDERRSNQRVRLFTPVTASTEEGSVRLLDLSSTGARMEHLFPLRVGSEVTLRLDYLETHLEVEASVVRSRIQQKAKRTTYTSAVQFATEDHNVLDAVSLLIRTIVHDDFPARVSYA